MNHLNQVDQYYTTLFTRFGVDPRGVDWNGNESQQMRFEAFESIVVESSDLQVCDFGCGYGALATFLLSRGFSGQYLGIDLSAAMIKAAQEIHRGNPNSSFEVGDRPKSADVIVASGTFNVIPDGARDHWTKIVWDMIEQMWSLATLGIAFNLLLPPSPPFAVRSNLFTCNPNEVISGLEAWGARVSVAEGYGLHEATYIARKS